MIDADTSHLRRWETIYDSWIGALEREVNQELAEMTFLYWKGEITDVEEDSLVNYLKKIYRWEADTDLDDFVVRPTDTVTGSQQMVKSLYQFHRSDDLNRINAGRNLRHFTAILLAEYIRDSYLRRTQNARNNYLRGIEDFAVLFVDEGDATPRIEVSRLQLREQIIPTLAATNESEAGTRFESLPCKSIGRLTIEGTSYRTCPDAEVLLRPYRLTSQNIELKSLFRTQEKGQIFEIISASVVVEAGLRNFVKALRQNTETYTYAVTPKDAAIRLDRRSESALDKALSLALSAKTQVASAEVKGAIESELAKWAQFVERRPLIVGLANHSSGRSAQFGWLLGPRLVTDVQGKAAMLHVPAQHALSAIVSVPGWWREADVVVTTQWLDHTGAVGSKDKKQIDRFKVLLPGDPNVITETIMGAQSRSDPTVRHDLMGDQVALRVGEPASILIPGRNLWRSTVVTLGAMKSSKITVLPNMEGILAKFPAVQVPADWFDKSQPYDKLKLKVWTSTAAVPVRVDVKLYQREPDPPEQVAKRPQDSEAPPATEESPAKPTPQEMSTSNHTLQGLLDQLPAPAAQ